MHLRRFLLKRFFLSIVTLFGALVVVFIMTHILPGNPAKYRAGAFAPPEAVEEIEKEMGLDKPLIVQFGSYLNRLVHGDLGTSWSTRRPVTEDLVQRLPATLELAITSFLIAVLIALPLGIIVAVKKNTFVDHVTRVITTLSSSIAIFWLGTMLIYIMYYKLRLAAAPTGRLDIGLSPPESITGFFMLDSILSGNMETLRSSLNHIILPALTLAFPVVAIIAKTARTSMLEIMQRDYVRTASALGMGRWRVVVSDALQNALVPVVTILALVFGFLMAGNVIVEMLFAWPGIGNYAWNALMTKDFDAVQGFMLFIAAGYIILNLLADVLYGFIDPRIRLGTGKKNV